MKWVIGSQFSAIYLQLAHCKYSLFPYWNLIIMQRDKQHEALHGKAHRIVS